MLDTEIRSKLQHKFQKYFPGIKWEEINDWFHFQEMEKVHCGYCGKELIAHQEYPYPDVPSIDHKLPLSKKGLNAFSNVEVCCHKCNIIKGTMKDSTYRNFLLLLSADELWKEQIMVEMFWGRQADKLRREYGKKEDKNNSKELWEYV